MKKTLSFGITSSMFFAFTFVLNQQMNLSGGSWLWSASLRYFFTLPILFIIILGKKQLLEVLEQIKRNTAKWILWSTVGFGLFYAPLSFASMYGAAWLVASTWQLTIVAGTLLTPLFYEMIETENGLIRSQRKIPRTPLRLNIIILLGVALMQIQKANEVSVSNAVIGIIPVLVAAFAYPLGNRKMMELCGHSLGTLQRIFGMTLCSMPFWFLIALYGMGTVGVPGTNQIIQSVLVAVFSGVIATMLFFKATDLVKHDLHKLAVVESTQSGEVIFTMLGSVLIFHDHNAATSFSQLGIIIDISTPAMFVGENISVNMNSGEILCVQLFADGIPIEINIAFEH